MPSMTLIAREFFEACEAGQGWEGCRAYCLPNATFAAQSEPLAEIRTLQAYTEWMKGLLTVLTDGRYELISFATDSERNNVAAYGLFVGTHLAGEKAIDKLLLLAQAQSLRPVPDERAQAGARRQVIPNDK